MNDDHPTWSRRKLLGYCGAGSAIALAGCGGLGSDADDEDDDGSSDGDESSNGENVDIAAEFELAGDGAEPFRNWLNPDHQMDEGAEDIKQLYQYNDFNIAEDRNWESMIGARQDTEEQLGTATGAIDSELLVGPIEEGVPAQILFGEFDLDEIGDHIDELGFDQAGEVGEYQIYGDRFAVSEEVLINHPSYETVIETADGDADRVEDVDEDIKLALDVIPEGMMTTVTRRDDSDDVVIDAMVVHDQDDGEQTHETRVFVFENADVASTESAQELLTTPEDVTTEERYERVVMVELQR